MSIPNLLIIAKEILPDIVSDSRQKTRKIISSMLGFIEGSWGELRADKEAELISELLDSEEYKAVKEKIKSEMLASMKNFKFSVKQRAAITSYVRDVVYDSIRHELVEELKAELSKQTLELISNEPTLQPALIAANLIKEANAKPAKSRR